MKIFGLAFATLMFTSTVFAHSVPAWEYIGKGYQSADACEVACTAAFVNDPYTPYTGNSAWQEKFLGKFKGWCSCEVMKNVEEGSDD